MVSAPVTIAQILWRLDSGEDLHAVAAHLGLPPARVEAAVQRSGRVDLLAKFARGRTL